MKNNVNNLSRISLKSKIKRALWNVVCFFLFRPFGTKLFNPWRNFLLRLFGAKIGSQSGVYSSAKIWAPWNLELGKNSWLGPNTICYNMDNIIIGNDVTISQNAHLCSASHNIDEVNNYTTSLIVSPIIIKDRVWVASDAFIGMGVTIGEGTVVGARAAVFKSVETWSVVGGNPAKFIKKRIIRDE